MKEIRRGTCGYCQKGIWFWQRADYLEEGYGDGKALCHVKCHNLKKQIDVIIKERK